MTGDNKAINISLRWSCQRDGPLGLLICRAYRRYQPHLGVMMTGDNNAIDISLRWSCQRDGPLGLLVCRTYRRYQPHRGVMMTGDNYAIDHIAPMELST